MTHQRLFRSGSRWTIECIREGNKWREEEEEGETVSTTMKSRRERESSGLCDDFIFIIFLSSFCRQMNGTAREKKERERERKWVTPNDDKWAGANPFDGSFSLLQSRGASGGQQLARPIHRERFVLGHKAVKLASSLSLLSLCRSIYLFIFFCWGLRSFVACKPAKSTKSFVMQ